MSEHPDGQRFSGESKPAKIEFTIKPIGEAHKDSDKKRKPDSENPKIFVHEFLVDFLGALVPGILFTIAITIAFVPIIHALEAVFSQSVDLPPLNVSIRQFLFAARNTPNAIWIGLFIFGILLSYTLGHLFYRRDPKKPDAKSFKLLSNGLLKKTDLNEKYPESDEEFIRKYRCSKKEYLFRCNFGCDNDRDCEFPYPYLDKYLETRGHEHLVKLIPWATDESSIETRSSRSKTYINRLKIRLETHHPEACRSIIRNEAHVRLAASMWYVGRLLWQCCAVAVGFFAMILFAFAKSGIFPPQGKTHIWCFSWSVQAILPAVIVTSFAVYCQIAIKRFLLYQRLREAFYVLEVAYTCFRDNPKQLNSVPINLT